MMASTILTTESTKLTIINDFWRCRCVYVRYDFSKFGALNELVIDGQRMPRTTLPRLKAAYVSLHNRAGDDVGLTNGLLLKSGAAKI